ncbi:hypothetical protein CTAYLR_006304 [Chrysophaeum taylorii]|uniref:tRNA-binding domain-containing protein n=1 Tax=Chrysophaeum taylorii TaxID=2483200 RepID=A0AAD7U9U8_9STRA|nr:hypothetical protein CTAYLR_006304 [Chrysophaeum taylorii]
MQVVEILRVEPLAAEKLKLVEVQTSEGTVDIVTNAPNVTVDKVGRRCVAALVGVEIGDTVVAPKVVGGRKSHGILCDSVMLKWSGGGAGTAVFVDLDVGAPPPSERPRPKRAELPATTAEGLFAKKPTKEDKKAAAKAAREARKAAKKGTNNDV